MDFLYKYAMQRIGEIREAQKNPYFTGITMAQVKDIELLVNEVYDEYWDSDFEEAEACYHHMDAITDMLQILTSNL